MLNYYALLVFYFSYNEEKNEWKKETIEHIIISMKFVMKKIINEKRKQISIYTVIS